MNTVLLVLILGVLVLALVPTVLLETAERLYQCALGLAVVVWLVFQIRPIEVHLPHWAEIALGWTISGLLASGAVAWVVNFIRAARPVQLPEAPIEANTYPVHPGTWTGF